MDSEEKGAARPGKSFRLAMPKGLLGLRAKMALGFGLLTALVVCLVSLATSFGIPFTSDLGSYGRQRSEILGQLGLVADLKKECLLLWLEERTGDAQVLSQSEAAVAFVKHLRETVRADANGAVTGDSLHRMLLEDETYRAVMRRLQGIVKSYAVYQTIQIADAERGVIIASTNVSDLGTPVAQTRPFTSAMKLNNRVAIDVERSPETGIPCLVMSRTIADTEIQDSARATAIGVLIMRIDADQFLKPLLYTGGGLGISGEIVLATQDLNILISLKYPLRDGTEAKPPEYQIDTELAVLAAGGHNGIVVSKDYRNERVLAAYRHIRVTDDLGWGMIVKIDEAEVFGPIRKNLRNALFIGFVGIIGAMILGVLIADRISGPIRRLSITARDVEAGNLQARAAVAGSDEVGNLASVFNSMVERVENWHRQLEEQVNARTAELSELNKELQAKNAELERFTYTVSHDIKSPLITIRGFLGYLETDMHSGNTERMKEDLGRISNAVDRIRLLLDDLLELSRIGRIVNNPEEVDLGLLAHEAAEMLAARIAQCGARVEISDDLPVARGDRSRLREVFENLLDNAIKFGGEGPAVKIGARCQGDETVIYVSDNGAGIDARYHEKIFGLFERLDQETEGAGVGLAIVKRIIETHGGRIWVESEGRDKGSTFCFTLPRGGVPSANKENSYGQGKSLDPAH